MSHWLDVIREPNHRDIMRRQSLQDRPNTTQASSSSGTTTLGNCPCTIGVGVVDPTVSSLFVHKQPYRWKQPGVMAALNAKDGFNLTAEPVAVWNTDSPSNSYISADITRTVTVDEVEYTDTYVLTVTEDSSFGWKSNVSIKSGAAANCPDQIDWTWVCSTPLSPPANTSTYMVLYGPETKKSEDNTDELTYLDPPGCGMCLIPTSDIETISICSGKPFPKTQVVTISNVTMTSSHGSYMPWQYSGGYALVSEVMAAVVADLEGQYVLDTDDAVSAGAPLSSSYSIKQASDLPASRSFTIYQNSDGSGTTSELVLYRDPSDGSFNHYNLTYGCGSGSENPVDCPSGYVGEYGGVTIRFSPDGDGGLAPLNYGAYLPSLAKFLCSATGYPTGWPVTSFTATGSVFGLYDTAFISISADVRIDAV